MPLLPDCAIEIAQHYEVPVKLIEAVREVEAGVLGRLDCGRYQNTCDIGPMQINTWWTENVLHKFDISLEEVRDNYCQNIAIGTWILRTEYERFGNWYKALAAYNAGAGRVTLGEPYARKVISRWNEK